MKMIYFLSLCIITVSCGGINKKLGLKDDNVFEQAAEEEIKKDTGIIVDFTPEKL